MGSVLVGRDSYGYVPLGMRVLTRSLVDRKQQFGVCGGWSAGGEEGTYVGFMLLTFVLTERVAGGYPKGPLLYMCKNMCFLALLV